MGNMNLNAAPKPAMFQPPAPGQGFNAPPAPGQGFNAPPPPGQGFNAPPPPGQGFNAPPAPQPPVNQFAPPANQFAPPPPGQAPNMGAPNNMAPGMQQPGMAPGMAPGMNANFVDASVDYDNVIPPCMFRPTSTCLPTSASMAASCKVPTGGILKPFTNPKDEEVDVVQPGAAGIIRCKRCRTYINPFVSWLENGRRWRCNICSQLNETASAYFCHLDEKNQRRDVEQRPELGKSVVEWIAPSEYMVRAPQAPSYFFVLDVSAQAVRSGMLHHAANAIKNSLDNLPGGERTMVGFITFDTAVHYYALRPGSSSPQMMVVGDLKELFIPTPDDLLVYVKDSREAIDSFLDNLPTMFANNTAEQSCLGPALKAAFTVMKAVGGKMSVFQSSMPTLGDGALRPRENVRLMGTPNEVKVLKPENSWYKDTAIEFSRSQIAVDMYLFPYQYLDVAALSELPKVTAGTLNTYVGFNSAVDGPKFESRLQRRLTQETAFESVLRIRCTKGMRISNFYGNFFIRGTDLLALPNCSADSVFGFDLVHDEQSINTPYVTIQSALLYTSSDGERRIRVATQVLKTTSKTSEFMASVDAEACATLLSKQAMNVAIKSNLDNARNRLQQTCVEMYNAAKGGDKRTVSGYTMPNQPQQQGGGDGTIPENLSLLPLYTLSLLKNVAFRGGTDVHPDERIAAHMQLNAMYVQDTLSYVHPRLFGIHDMSSQAGLPANEDSEGETAGRNGILLPDGMGLSVDNLSSEGAYLLANRQDVSIWVGRACNPSVIRSLFGVDSLENIDPSQLSLASDGNDIASRLDSIIMSLHEESDPALPPHYPKIQIIREGDMALEARFFWNFVEDRAQFNGGTYSYQEFMEFCEKGGTGNAGGPPPPGQPPGRNPMPPSAPSSMPMNRGPMPPGGMPPGPPSSGMMPPPAMNRGPPGPPQPPSSMPNPAMNRGPPGPPTSGQYNTGPPMRPPTSGGYNQGPPMQPPSSGGYNQGPPMQPPSSGGYSQGPPTHHAPPSGPPMSSGPPSRSAPPPPQMRGPPPPPGPPR
jgi:protein transport protein SEC24